MTWVSHNYKINMLYLLQSVYMFVIARIRLSSHSLHIPNIYEPNGKGRVEFNWLLRILLIDPRDLQQKQLNPMYKLVALVHEK